MSFKIDIAGIGKKALAQVNGELPARAAAASIKLRNAEIMVMRGSRSGKLYHRTGFKRRYRASAPGEPPAVRTGTLRSSFRPVQYGANHHNPAIESNVEYAGYMDEGTPGGMIKPRPFSQKTVELAKPEIEAIYGKPFNISP